MHTESHVQVTELASDVGYVEGPVVLQSSSLVVTSISHGCLYQIDGGGARVLADVGGGPNGAAEGPDGSIFVAQMGRRRGTSQDRPLTGGIQRVAPDGNWTWVTQDPVAPNDLCFGPDGWLYWTDPTRDRFTDGRLWRCEPGSEAEPQLLVSVPWYPNGIAFGPENDAVYVADYGGQRIVRFPLTSSGFGTPETVIQMSTGHPDGLAFDINGDLIVAANSRTGGRGQIQTWTTTGKLLDTFEPGYGSKYTNIALDERGTLFVTHSDGGRVIQVTGWPTAGLPLHPFRVTAEGS
jgi:gluconolactonase